jgi:hypothetical protein
MKSIKCLLLLGASIALAACGGQGQEQAAEKSAYFAPPIASASITTTQTFPGSRAAYSIKQTGSGFIVTENGTANTNIIPASITSLSFSDATVNLTVAGKVATTSAKNVQQILELYIAFFNRVPEADGLVYWIDQVAAGMSISAIAESFYSAALQYSSISGYTNSMTDADFIKIVYKNVLGRSSVDESGMNYWSSSLATGKETRGSLVVTILNSAHSFKGDPTYGKVADLLDNRLLAANYFAVIQGLNYKTPSESITKGMLIASAVTAIDFAFAKSLVKVGADATNGIFSPVPDVLNGGVTAQFIDKVKNASCSNLRNRLSLIDQKFVFWDRAGSCPDAAQTQILFGNTTKTILCSGGDSLMGPKVMCEDESARTLFLSMVANRNKADLGLGSGYRVKQIDVPPGVSIPLAFTSYKYHDNFSLSATQRQYVMRDDASWRNFWDTVVNRKVTDVLGGINFAKQMAVGVFTSTTNTGVCGSIDILKANSNGQKLSLEYIEDSGQGSGSALACYAGWANNAHMNLITLERNDLSPEFVDVSDKLIKYVLLDNGYSNTYGITTPQNLVIKDQATWEKLWAKHSVNNSNMGTPAVLDFSKNMVIAVFLGSTGNCKNIVDMKVWRSEGKLNVAHRDSTSGFAVPCDSRDVNSAFIMQVPRFEDAPDIPVEFIAIPQTAG